MAYQPAYEQRVGGSGWKNSPNTSTPLNADNLNKGDYALWYHDMILSELYGSFEQIKDAYGNQIIGVSYNNATGVWRFTRANGDDIAFDQNIEKIPNRFELLESGYLRMYQDDGTYTQVDLSALLFEFNDSDNIKVHVSGEGTNRVVTIEIDPDYLSEMKTKWSETKTFRDESALNVQLSQSNVDTSLSNALRAQASADIAAAYANYVYPSFIIENNRLYYRQNEAQFVVSNNRVYIKIT